MIDHDRLFKELISTFFVEFLELFFPEVVVYLEPDSISFENTEIFTDVTAGEQYEADVIVKARFRGQESFFLIHVENQASPQSNFGRRMFRYFARLYEKFAIPVYPVVIFSYDTPLRPEPNIYRVEFPDKVVLEFNYAVIQLNQLNWRDFLQQENPIASALMAKMNIAPEDRPRVKSECLRLLATIRLDPARMQLISGFVDTYLRLNAQEEEIFQSEIANFELVEQEIAMEIITSWMEEGLRRGLQQGRQEGIQEGRQEGIQEGRQEGIQEGRQEGIQEGRQEGELAVIMRLLPRRIGTLEPELQERIRELSLAQLEDLAEALLDFTNKDDLVVWLDGNSEVLSN